MLRTKTLRFDRRPLIMGIVNVTPDSFSDGGKFLATDVAIEHGLRLVEEGADIVDVGGESTRPYSTPVDSSAELERIVPVVKALCKQVSVPVSIDTSKASVAQVALDCGAEIVNDVTGLEGDKEMLPLVISSQAGVCAMHMQGNPQTMQDNPSYHQVTTDVRHYLKERRDMLEKAGFDPSRICLDPGIGFGKSHDHNLTLLANCWRLHELRCPLLIGHSRKGFIGRILGDKSADRTVATAAITLSLARQGVQIVRVHDVKPNADALRAFEAVGGTDGVPVRIQAGREP